MPADPTVGSIPKAPVVRPSDSIAANWNSMTSSTSAIMFGAELRPLTWLLFNQRQAFHLVTNSQCGLHDNYWSTKTLHPTHADPARLARFDDPCYNLWIYANGLHSVGYITASLKPKRTANINSMLLISRRNSYAPLKLLGVAGQR